MQTPPAVTNARKKQPSARVLVISSASKAKNTTKTNWNKRAESGFVNLRPTPTPAFRDGIQRESSNILPSHAQSQSPVMSPSSSAINLTTAAAVSAKKTSKTISQQDFPGLPTSSNSNHSQVQGAGSTWNSVAVSEPKPEIKRNKKGKQVLMHFG